MKRMSTLLSMTTLMIVGTISQGQARAASSLRIGIAVPGVEGKIAAHAAQNGDVSIDEYPTRFAGSVKLLTMTSPIFGRTLSDAVCDAVADRAALAVDDSFPADLRKLALENVRKDNSFSLEATVATFFGTSAFNDAAKAAAVAAGVQAQSYQVTNPLTGRSFEVSLELDGDAISRKIGDAESLTRQLKALLQTTGGLAMGKSQGEIGAADLVCDLRSGKARIVTRIVGSVATGNASEPLFEASVAQALYDGLKAELAETPDSYTAAQRLVADGIAVSEAAKAAGAALDTRNVAVIAAKLFDSRTGSLVEVATGRIQQVLSAPQDGARFEGSSSLVFNQ